jgi:hypothetical protein
LTAPVVFMVASRLPTQCVHRRRSTALRFIASTKTVVALSAEGRQPIWVRMRLRGALATPV